MFSVGLSAQEFQGSRKVGDTKESIGINGEFKVLFIDSSAKQQSITLSESGFELSNGIIIGVGYIFQSKKVLFTINGKEVDAREIPMRMKNKIIYPAISLGSRDQHRVEVNLGLKKFKFNIEAYLRENHYREIYGKIVRSDTPLVT
jgi:hypothetical protein